MKVRLWLLSLAVLTSGCLRAGEERAERDLEVGQFESEDVRVTVTNGHAVIRQASLGRLELWASTPTFDVLVQSPGAPSAWVVDVKNAMVDADLRASGAEVVTALPSEVPTQKSWRVDAQGESVRFAVTTPDAGERGGWRFALLSDIQEAIGGVQDIYETMNQEQVEAPIRFLLGAGDLTENGRPKQLARFQRELEQLEMPYYTTLGNHELGAGSAPWQEWFGPASFQFSFRGVRFTLLDSAGAGIDPVVYSRLEGWLQAGREDVHIAAMHIPPLDPVGVRNGGFASRNEAAKLLTLFGQSGVDLTLYGHIHSHYRFENGGIRAHISGGGGAIPERLDGIGRHFMVFEVDADRGIVEERVVRVK